MAGFYGGYMGNAGVMTPGGFTNQAFGLPQPGAMVAGSPSFDINPNRQPMQPGMGPQAPNMYMPTQILDPRTRQQRMEQSVPTTAVRMAGLMPGMTPMGNAAGVANAGFYRGPQYGQMPVGFSGKSIS
jgi:hypothetical protein